MGRARVDSSAQEHPLLLEHVLHTVFSFLDCPQDRRSVSEVCRQWYEMDGETRQHIYIAFVYSVSPSRLSSRFRNITGLKLKAKPRAYEFALLPRNWGGHAAPWIQEIITFPTLSELHLRRMEVSDDDLLELARGFSTRLQSLKLDFCNGFSTIGLREITRSCRSLKLMYLENSEIGDEGGEWLHELALHNTSLEVLSFQLATIINVNVEDIKAIIKNCPGLKCLKLPEGEAALGDGLLEVLSKSTSLRELGVFLSSPELEEDHPPAENNLINGRRRFELPKGLMSISGDIPPCLFWPIASQLVKLDLMTVTEFTAQQHHELLRRCPKLQNLQVRTIIGDEGLRIVGRTCKELLKVRIEEQSDADAGAFVSHLGLIALAEGCPNLQKLAIYVSDISNAALLAVGRCCPNLLDFRFILIDALADLSDPTLDAGFEGLMRGCSSLSRLCIYARQGTLTDAGLERIGRHSSRLKALLLGGVGDSDEGFLALAPGCRTLERLEMRDCPFTDDGLVRGAAAMPCLKLLWVQGFNVGDPEKLAPLTARFRVECTRRREGRNPEQCVIYRSLAGPRTDCPEEIVQVNEARQVSGSPNGHGALTGLV